MNVQVQTYTKDVELNGDNPAIKNSRGNSSIIEAVRKP